MTHDAFRNFILSHTWIFAKTYASFCPHEYVVKGKLPPEEQKLFEEIVLFIREKGFLAIYGKKAPNQYYIIDDNYYWTMPDSLEATDILNRAKLTDYDFIETAQGLIVRKHENMLPN